MSSSEQAAVSAAHELLGVEAPAEAEATVASSTEQQEEVEFPSFDVELPADLAAELAEPEVNLELDDDEEFDALVEEYGDNNNELISRLRKAEKKAAHFEELRTKEAKKTWQEEAKKYFPLAKPVLDDITATSRRGYLRTAKDFHDRMLPQFEEAVKAAKVKADETKAVAVEETKAEVREAWGQVITQNPPSEAAATHEAVTTRRRRGEFSDTVRSMIFAKPEGGQ